MGFFPAFIALDINASFLVVIVEKEKGCSKDGECGQGHEGPGGCSHNRCILIELKESCKGANVMLQSTIETPSKSG